MDFRRIYPKGPNKIFLDGGINSKFEKSLIQENESPDCLNVIFENGSVGTRGGTSKLNTASVGSFVFDALYTRLDKSGAETMVAFANGLMYTLGVTTFTTVPSAQSVFTAGSRVGAAQAENYIFFGNGGVTPYKYNGAEFTRHGIPAPPSASVATSQAAGTLTGDYRYKVTYINSGVVQGDVGPAMSTFTAASATIRVTIPTAPASHGVEARRIYRTEAGGSTYKLLTTVSNTTATYYDDNLEDTTLGATAPTDQGEPPNWNIAVFHPGVQRMFCLDPSNENYVVYSEAGNPYVFKATNFDTFGDKAGDIVEAMEPVENGMIVFCKRRSYLWYFPDNDPTNWLKAINQSAYGSRCPFAVMPYKNGVIAPATENGKFVGFAHFVGNAAQPDAQVLATGTMASDLISERIEPIIFEMSPTYLKNMSGVCFRNKIYFSVPYGTTQTTNNRVLVFDYSYSRIKDKVYSWALWDGINAVQFTIYGGKLYYASSVANGHVYEMNTTSYNDDGSAINSYFYTKEFFGYSNESDNHKDFRFANLLLDLAGDYFMDIVLKVDSDKGVGITKQIDIDPGTTLWGTGIWGTSTWGGGKYQQNVRVDLGTLNGKRIQFKFSNQNTANQRFKIHHMSYQYNLKGLR